MTVTHVLQKMSDVLENCRSYAIKDFNTQIKPCFASNSSMIFQNIDGNKTNFDAFSMELDQIAEKFKIIGLAETNIGIEESTVYHLEDTIVSTKINISIKRREVE